MKSIANVAFGWLGRWWRLSLLVALAGCLTGCLIIPTPPTNSGHARTNVDRRALEQFTAGRTTREDVIVALGEPDAVSSDERQLCYRSEKLVALWVFVASEYSGPAGGAIYRNHFYVFEFDPQGRFQSARRTGEWGAVEAAHQPLPKVAE